MNEPTRILRANNDGAQALCLIKERGGLTIVQDPKTAEAAYMPKAALEAKEVDCVPPLSEIDMLLLEISRRAII